MGLASLTDAEAQLAAIKREAEALETTLAAIQAQHDLARASASHHADADALLARLRERLEDVEQADDWDLKRQIVELLVAGIRVETIGEGQGKRANLTISYTFGPRHVVDATTGTRTGTRRDAAPCGRTVR